MARLAAAAKRLGHRLGGDHGQTMSEYAVILTVIAAGILTVIVLLSGNIGAVLTRIAGLIN
jgi:Flp pilus assembly pilin Flp